MCLSLIISRRLLRPKKVYKVLLYEHDALRSPIKDFYYALDHRYHTNICDMRDSSDITGIDNLIVNVSMGLHGYTSIKEAMAFVSMWPYYDLICFAATIPAKAMVIEGDKKEIVSTDLIVHPYYYVPVKIGNKVLFYRKKKWNK